MADLTLAEAQAKGLWYRTPLIESINLSKAAGCQIFLKLENLQPSGAFKSRGLGYHCAKILAASKKPERVHFYSSSGGNAGLACVCAANALHRPSTVVVPFSTKEFMIAKIKAAGASQVIQHGANWQEADTYLREHVMREAEARGDEAVYINPFNHPNIWAGHSTMISEIKEQFKEQRIKDQPDAMICSVGGGGLFIGVADGLKQVEWTDTTLVAVETVGADSLGQSMVKGEHITLPAITSLATTLGAVRVADRAFEIAHQGQAAGKVRSCVLTDAEAVMGIWRFADDERFLVEPSCGVNLALCYDGRLSKALGRPVKPDDKIVIIVCGGQGVSTSMVEAWRQEYGIVLTNADRMMQNGPVPSEVTAP